MMTAELFERGMRWSTYEASMQANRTLLQRKRAEFRLPAAERERWQESPLHAVLVFTEDWCQDSISALPPLLALAEAAPLHLRVFRRSEALALQQQLTGNPYPPIPLFLFYDEQWQEQGRFVEMPRAFRALKADPTEAFWLQEMYDQLWWETELAELATIAAAGTPRA